jgi:plasmid maintenance system killer protein
LKKRPAHITFFSLLLFTVFANKASAQYRVKGHVYDSTRTYPIELVTVQSTSGHITITDSTGSYSINVAEKDSIWFSYLGKPTPKYPVLKIADVTQFDIALHLKPNVMREVKIRTRNHKEDSLQNRRDYAKAFNFRKPSLETMTSVTSSGVGFDVQEIIRLFQFRKNRSMERFRERLEQEERDKFIDRRFSKGLVKRLTGIDKDEELTDFMRKYRPTFEFTAGTSDYDFQYFIKIAYQEFKKTVAAKAAF